MEKRCWLVCTGPACMGPRHLCAPRVAAVRHDQEGCVSLSASQRDLPFAPRPGALHAVILAGGPGERFWPASTPEAPKPFVRLFGGGSLLQETLARAARLAAPADTWLVGSEVHGERLRAAASGWLPASNVLLEPARRDTAPAVALAASAVAARDPDATLLVMPSDHYVPDAEAFARTVRRALPAAARGLLVCVGITPLRPEPRYGYIVAGEGQAAPGVHPAERFVEKPAEAEARRLLASGRAYWNAGLLICRTATLRAAFAAHAPSIVTGVDALQQAADPAKAYAALPSISLDYAVLQKAVNVAVAPADFRWHDVGGWAELPLVEADAAGNFVRGPARLIDTADSVVYNTGRQPVVVRGMQGVLVAQTASHVTLVSPLGGDTRQLLRDLEASGGVPQPQPADALWAAAEAGAPGVQLTRHAWGAEAAWSEGADHAAALVRVFAGRRARWRCPDGWRETGWLAAGRGTRGAGGAGEGASPAVAGGVLRATPGEDVELQADTDLLIWRLRLRSAAALGTEA